MGIKRLAISSATQKAQSRIGGIKRRTKVLGEKVRLLPNRLVSKIIALSFIIEIKVPQHVTKRIVNCAKKECFLIFFLFLLLCVLKNPHENEERRDEKIGGLLILVVFKCKTHENEETMIKIKIGISRNGEAKRPEDPTVREHADTKKLKKKGQSVFNQNIHCTLYIHSNININNFKYLY